MLDLRGLSFIDASGLAELLRAATDAGRSRCSLGLIAGEAVIGLLKLSRLARALCYTEPPRS